MSSKVAHVDGCVCVECNSQDSSRRQSIAASAATATEAVDVTDARSGGMVVGSIDSAIGGEAAAPHQDVPSARAPLVSDDSVSGSKSPTLPVVTDESSSAVASQARSPPRPQLVLDNGPTTIGAATEAVEVAAKAAQTQAHVSAKVPPHFVPLSASSQLPTSIGVGAQPAASISSSANSSSTESVSGEAPPRPMPPSIPIAHLAMPSTIILPQKPPASTTGSSVSGRSMPSLVPLSQKGLGATTNGVQGMKTIPHLIPISSIRDGAGGGGGGGGGGAEGRQSVRGAIPDLIPISSIKRQSSNSNPRSQSQMPPLVPISAMKTQAQVGKDPVPDLIPIATARSHQRQRRHNRQQRIQAKASAVVAAAIEAPAIPSKTSIAKPVAAQMPPPNMPKLVSHDILRQLMKETARIA